MRNLNRLHFDLLKQRIVERMQTLYPGINPDIAAWRGQEIIDFQEDLLQKSNARISEKWFYNHIKSNSHSLPRIDVLNLLSRYVGYANWDDFVFRSGIREEKNEKPVFEGIGKPDNRVFIFVPLIVLGITGLLYLAFLLFSNRPYRFMFYDSNTHERIRGTRIVLTLLPERESPMPHFSNEEGEVVLKSSERNLRMVVSAPYYRTDTIVRILKTFENEQNIFLQPDEYALVLHYFSQMKEADWQKRRSYLEKMISDDAIICQVMGTNGSQAMELFNKQEFINKMTIPSASLRNLEILSTRLRDDRISVLHFRVNSAKP